MRILGPVKPTPEQLKILASNRPGVMVIRGAAGSGKTTTALLRLRQLCEFWGSRRERLGLTDPVRVLVLTFNRTLEGYITELARQQVTGHRGLQLRVRTFSKWAKDLAGNPSICDGNMSERLLQPLLTNFGGSTDFLIDEVHYILNRFPPGHFEDYLTVKREGRGATPRVDQSLRRRLIDEVLGPYAAVKASRGVMDWNDIAVAAAGASDMPPWDVIIIDEAQDFSANQVRTVLSRLADPGSVTFVMDAVQRIYPRYFTWREVGVTVSTDAIHTLRSNYRNTREIAAFARPLVAGLPKDDDGNLPDFEACTKSGPKPVVFEGRFSDQIDHMLARLLTTVDFADESVAFLHPKGWFGYLKERLDAEDLQFVELTRASVWPTGPEAIALCTLHSAKGLEFDHVVLPGLNAEVTPHGTEAGDYQLETLRRLIAMGVGRARKSVMLGYKPGYASTIVSLLDPTTYELMTL